MLTESPPRTEEAVSMNADSVDRCLQERFGLPAFRPMQRDAVNGAIAGRDTLVVMPTGGGKSLCYQLPALMLPGITIVVSPLIALMKDQADRLQRLRIPAVAINSTLNFGQMRAVIRRAQAGQIKVLFVAPERLESATFREELGGLQVSLLAIDEAHCISEWGHDFRTSYRRLPEVFESFADNTRPPIIALTATATPEVRADIVALLGLTDPLEIVTGFERSNLAFGVLRECEKEARVKDIVKSVTDGSVIIYGATRKSVDGVTRMLTGAGYSAEAYHAGLPAESRRRTQERFQSGKIPIIVATSAFGMGVDKSDVRVVIHYDLPGSLEAYYQEAGRAGRDGKPAHAVLLFNNGDARIQEFLIRANSPSEAEVKSIYTALQDIAGNTLGSVYPGLLATDTAQIEKRLQVKTGAPIERCVEILEQAGYLRYYRNQGREQRSKVIFTTSRGRVDEILFKTASKHLKAALNGVLRAVGSEAFRKEVFFDHEALLRNQQLSQQDFTLAIRSLESLGVLRFTAPQRARPGVTAIVVTLLGERIPIHRLDVGAPRLEKRLSAGLQKLEEMMKYATEWTCRRNTILHYFGERPEVPYCGICDVCTARSRGADSSEG